MCLISRPCIAFDAHTRQSLLQSKVTLILNQGISLSRVSKTCNTPSNLSSSSVLSRMYQTIIFPPLYMKPPGSPSIAKQFPYPSISSLALNRLLQTSSPQVASEEASLPRPSGLPFLSSVHPFVAPFIPIMSG